MISKRLPYLKITKRLIIRPLELHDYENWEQAYSCQRPVQNEWDTTNWKESELTLAKFKETLKNEKKLRAQDKYYNFGVFRKDDGVLIGQVALMDVSRGVFNNAYLGYRIFNNHWGQGYAQEACKAAIHIAFKNIKLHRIEAGIEPKNKRSIRVAKALGLRKEGLSKKRLLFNKKWVDLLLFAMTKEEF
ncbi:ribosomal-protein-alanine acetyltransferase [Bdellovibrio bacteriovorus]|uniref:Ribosomal-protein-alanine acetyltransferase n=1 Tax=Bdellovibrio bacteriovorus TaxID=959 RepID=A0A150WD30_BDEBC|nr:GNAT family protein [Bdellovibrio bacteriovorus]KYG60984.1 ribosomal-protein-alanine acetyltransferase [Bdellovibrio bacteriovorus]